MDETENILEKILKQCPADVFVAYNKDNPNQFVYDKDYKVVIEKAEERGFGKQAVIMGYSGPGIIETTAANVAA